MAIPQDLNSRQDLALIEATSKSGQPGQVVVNPDGSNISGGGGGASGVADKSTFVPGTQVEQPVGGIYQTAPDTLTNNQTAAIGIDANRNAKVREQFQPQFEDNTNGVAAQQVKPVASSVYAPNVYIALTQVAAANLKATFGNVFSSYITNINAAVRYFQLFNKATAPVATDVPILSLPIPAGSATVPGVLLLDRKFYSEGGFYLPTGIGWAVSTTYGTLTLATATDHIPVITWI